MMRALVLLHRWLGVALSPLFAMWFASGIVMHFVPFPALTAAARFSGLAPLDLAAVKYGPADAVRASGLRDVARVRLLQRSDGPVYRVSSGSARKTLRAGDLADGAVRSGALALAIARDYASHRGLDGSNATIATEISRDQWTVSEYYAPDRPLYRIALNDDRGTDVYVASTTGEAVLETTARVRAWNYAGSIAHWIYPTALRSHAAFWSALVWWLSLAALIGAIAGALVGLWRVGADEARLLTPYRGWQALHHLFGLICMIFVLTFMLSGWLSMDSGLLFSTGEPGSRDAGIVAGAPDWSALSAGQVGQLGESREVEWFAFDGRIYRRTRTGPSDQRLAPVLPPQDEAAPERHHLSVAELDALATRLAPGCGGAAVIPRDDDYAIASAMPDAPVFRLRCGDVWFDIDGATGALLEKLDPSRRVYRWLYDGLHTLDFPILTGRPRLRTALIVTLCGSGFLFSITGLVLALRRLLLCWRGPKKSRA